MKRVSNSSQSPVWWGLKLKQDFFSLVSLFWFQPVASMMRIETAWSGAVGMVAVMHSSQSPVWWGLKPMYARLANKNDIEFQPVASMMRIETVCNNFSPFKLNKFQPVASMMRIETLKHLQLWSRGYILFQPVASMMRIETSYFKQAIKNMEHSSQSPVWWGLKHWKPLCRRWWVLRFQPVASMMRIETLTQDELKVICEGEFQPVASMMRIETTPLPPPLRFLSQRFQPVASMMRIETFAVQNATNISDYIIPASRQYDEDWNRSNIKGSSAFNGINSSQSPVWWGLKPIICVFKSVCFLYSSQSPVWWGLKLPD